MKLSKIISITKTRTDKVYDISHKLEQGYFYDEHPNLIINDKVISNCSRHAGGLVLGDDLSNDMPLKVSGGVVQTPWSEGQNVRHLEPFGFIKYDILGIETLNVMEQCIRKILMKKNNTKDVSFQEIKEWYNSHLDPSTNNLDDQEVFQNVFIDGKFPGIFQFTDSKAQEFCKKVEPKSIYDISVITSIYRPGPLSANVHHDFLKAKNNSSRIKYAHEKLIPILSPTLGFLIFQEQISQVAHVLGDNIDLNEANILRKLLTKKGTGPTSEKLEKIRQKFLLGCLNNGLTKNESDHMWENMENFSTYGFNQAHSLSYSIISYQCAYLFAKHPYEWLSSFLDKETDDKKEAAISLVKSLGYSIEPVSIQNSDEFWTYDEGKFIQPFTSIKGLGEKAIEQIYLARPFSSIEDLLFNEKMTYSKFNKRALDVLIRSDALKELMDERFNGTKHFWKAVAEDRPKTAKALKDNIEKYKDEGEFSLEEKIEFGVTLTGMYPMNLILTEKKHKALKSCDVNQISDYDYENPFSWFVIISKQEKVTAKGKKYSILTVTDLTNVQYQIKCWHGTDGLLPHNVYISKLDYEENWGFSTRTENNYRKI